MDTLTDQTPSNRTKSRRGLHLDLERMVRALPIRWRIISIATLNSAAVVIIAGLLWNGATTLHTVSAELTQVRQSEALLTFLAGESGRLQNLIHRYINEPAPELFAEILQLRQVVLETLHTRGSIDPTLSASGEKLAVLTRGFFSGFGELLTIQSAISRIYEGDVLKPAKEMAGLYAVIDGVISKRDALIWPSLGKSREAFTATLVAANAYYLSLSPDAAEEAARNIMTIEQTIPVMSDLAENDLQRSALAALSDRAHAFGQGLTKLGDYFTARTTLLRTAIDGTQAEIISNIDRLSEQLRQREGGAQARFDRTLGTIYRRVAVISLLFLSAMVFGGLLVAQSIRTPLHELMVAMQAIVSGQFDRRIKNVEATDEVGEMARAIEVFRENAIAKHRAEADLRTSKERAENALKELRETQKNLIDAEKLAALGGLVAGVAHEVNNPVGISLTVASSLARRCELFTAELKDGQLRRSRLDDFIDGTRDAAQQLVANLHRAGDLIRSFKQVAVDRSHAERRQFDLREATDNIIASLRPALKQSHIELLSDVPTGILMDSYPGSYGQVLTNLFLNAVVHAFPDGRGGKVAITAYVSGEHDVEIAVSDDGIGMSSEIRRRAFDPFFTTRRNQGGTGLGLHIIHNLVTQTLGGRLTLESEPGRGSTFHMILPRSAPREATDAPSAASYG